MEMVTECIYRRKSGQEERATHQVVSLGGKQEEKGKKKNRLPRQKHEGKGENFVLPWMSLCLFILHPVIFPSIFPPSLFHLCPKSSTVYFPHFFIFLALIMLSPSVSLRHVFQSLPSIDTVSTNSSPPVPSGEPLWKEESWGRATGEGLPGTGWYGWGEVTSPPTW